MKELKFWKPDKEINKFDILPYNITNKFPSSILKEEPQPKDCPLCNAGFKSHKCKLIPIWEDYEGNLHLERLPYAQTKTTWQKLIRVEGNNE